MFDAFRPLPPIDKSGGQVKRSVAFVDRTPVVVFEKQGRSLAPTMDCDWEMVLGQFDCGPAIRLETSGWNWGTADWQNFNCHALAIGSSVGVRPNQWLEGLASPATMHHNPAGTLLSRFFDRIRPDSHVTQEDTTIRENDVFVCYHRDQDHYVHSGFLKWIAGIPMAISKFGEGPIMITTLKLIERFYRDAFDELRWYRPTKQSDRQSKSRHDHQPERASSVMSSPPLIRPANQCLTPTVA